MGGVNDVWGERGKCMGVSEVNVREKRSKCRGGGVNGLNVRSVSGVNIRVFFHFLTSVPYGGGQLHTPVALTPGEEPLTGTEEES